MIRHPSAVAALAALSFLVMPPLPRVADAHDECSSATPITRLGSTLVVPTDAATANASDPEPSCRGGTETNVWYRYTARSDVSLELDTTGSTYDTVLAVYTGACGALTEIACNDDGPSNTAPARLVVPLDNGQTVLIAVASVAHPGDSLHLTARKSRPRYRNPASFSEIQRSSDPSAFGGSQGFLLNAVALTEKTTAFAQSTGGIFLDVDGVLTTIAHSGSPTPVGGTFSTVHAPAVTATSLYFVAEIDGGPVPEGIFKWSGGSLVPYLLPNVPLPGDVQLRDFGSRIAASEAGTIAFIARTAGASARKLVTFDGTTAAVVAAQDAATPCGGTFRAFETTPAIDDAGTTVVFVAEVRDVGSAIFTAAGGTLTAIACEDDPTPLGGTYRAIGPRPAINDLGEVYFATVLQGGASAGEAIWRWAAGSATAVATADMILAGGETIRRISVNQELATDATGDAVFTASLTGIGRSIVRAAHLAPLPAAIVLRTDACPLGGSFEDIDDELDLAATGTVVFDAACDGGHGAFRKPLGGAVTTVASRASATAVGSGMSFGSLRIDAAGTRIAAVGFRTTLQTVTCRAAGCDGPTALLAAATPLANAPGQSLLTIDDRTLAGTATTLAFLGTTAGVAHRPAVLRLAKGKLEVVASEGDPLPGGVGTFVFFTDDDPLFVGGVSPLGLGAGTVAFHAAIEHPTASQGIFAATSDGLAAIALRGDPAPRGEFFDDLGVPVVRGRSIVFYATTTEGEACVFATKAAGRKIGAVACGGDALPAPIGGTIGDFLSPPSGSADDVYVIVEVDDGAADACLVRYRKRAASLVRCEDDVYVGGEFYYTLGGSSLAVGPVTDAGVDGLVFAATGLTSDRDDLVAVRRKTFFPLFTAGVTPAPLSGGTIEAGFGMSTSMAGKSVVVATPILGGTAGSAVFRAVLR